jgi:trans-AT polyketide synthase/acyltransferase/oxidoreductase domain-containing protein
MKQGVVGCFGTRENNSPGMGCELFSSNEPFREAILRCDHQIERTLGWSLREELFRSGDHYRLHRSEEHMEPAMTAYQIALVEMLRNAGVVFDAVFGICVGEFAAGYAAGHLTREQAIELSCRISTQFRRRSGLGRMLNVHTEKARIEALIPGSPEPFHLSSVFHDRCTIISCSPGSLSAIEAYFEHHEISHSHVPTEFGLHSPLTDPWQLSFTRPLDRPASAPAVESPVPYFSAISGTAVAHARVGVDHWWGVISEPILGIEKAIHRLFESGQRLFLDVNAGDSMSRLLRRHAEANGTDIVILSVPG